ncbi:MAG TPA: magnesium/cobalt transporter CorA [Aggregatilinea sp.]|jgi:magnesium transporter|uniref:magnesium/cobalt transporter CorA n=1 Tax=Aggregatilinea sp. TaxID=2806333 RepID=UPI002B6DEAA9|nr:magnesium/cobalt transporter CorA [Aggregatilinea sp.]HML24359.1 magnesium/cobalt transporter CorA [Aggregatilinea sp.]
MAIQTIHYGRVAWTNIEHVTPEDMQLLRETYPHFHPLDLEDLQSRIERPKLDEYDDYLFVVMHFPLWDPVQRVSRASEVDMFVGSGYLVTVSDGSLKPLRHMFEQCEANPEMREQLLGRGGSKTFYAVIDRLVDYIFPILYKVDANIRELEEEIFTEDSRHIIQDLSFIRRDILALRRIIRPQILLLENLEKVDRPFIREELDVYFGDIQDHLVKGADIVEEHLEIINGLSDTANTLVTYRLNEVMRILTVISVLMLPLTLISGIYGMNVDLPFQRTALSFEIVIGLMFVIATGMLAYFRHRGWL